MTVATTSLPLHIDDLPLGNGRLGITSCPGVAPGRDLHLDMDAIKEWGANAVLSLLDDQELDKLGVTGLGEATETRNIQWLRFPINDMSVPTDAAMGEWAALSAQLHRILEGGSRIVVHCRGGRGRAGAVAALIMTERGWPASRAIDDIRAIRQGAFETDAQRHWVVSQSRPSGPAGDRLHGCLLGGAIGDSLGADIEFLSLEEIQQCYPDGLTDLPPHNRIRGAITDDTQMTLFTAEGLIRARVQDALNGTGTSDPLLSVHGALLRWLRTQGEEPRVSTDEVGLIKDCRLWVPRAPGTTCCRSLAESPRLGHAASNDSKGCGTIMRVAPVALMVPRDQIRAIAIGTSALTHGHPTGQLAAAAWAEMLADVAAGKGLEESADATATEYGRLENGGETADAIRKALEAERDGRPETVETLGGGWVAEEALSIALYACLAGGGFEETLKVAVTHGGDSDSVGAIAGNMMGVLDPSAVLQHRWAPVIECADVINRLVRDYLRLEQDHDCAGQLARFYPGA